MGVYGALGIAMRQYLQNHTTFVYIIHLMVQIYQLGA